MGISSRKWVAAGALGALVAAAGATALHYGGVALPLLGAAPGAATGTVAVDGGAAGTGGANDSTREEFVQRYIVVFHEAALASYGGERAGLAAPQTVSRAGKRRLDVRGAEASRYVQFLQGAQRSHESRIAGLIGRQPQVERRMQHALNAVVMKLTETEAARVARDANVRLVEAYREIAMDTDVGPRLIGAEPVWNGTVPGIPSRYQGEGVVIGVIDSGINHDSPSFAAVDPIDGYTHVNPLGSGTYLGSCAPGGPDAGKCNDKLIGGYDFVCDVTSGPGTICGQPATFREEPGFNDTNGHGSHTAGTAAGNRRDAAYKGRTVRISGVAPRANIIAYDACYTEVASGRGLCPNVSTVASINQAVADGVVDVINYSIGGGASPWTEATSLAFLNASDAGIYVAASAGNSGPGPNTMGHHEPWVGSTAAAQHGRADYSYVLQVTGPAPVPSSLQSIILTEGSGGPAFAAGLPANTPLRVSAGINTASDGCAAYPAGTFAGAIAVIRRGTCSFAIKSNNAAAAGAVALVIANNAPGGISPSVPGTTIPAFGILQTDGNALASFAAGNGNTSTAAINFPATQIPNVADALAAFSSRGPAGNFALLKPDITAPGVNVIAAYAVADANANDSQLVAAISGTSMASPHHAGAAALLRQAHPTWSVPEIKSALMLTAKQEVFLEDQVTPANPFAKGAGRVQVNDAIRAGLVMHETTANYQAANPAPPVSGDPSRLNQPSLISTSCVSTCTFQRTLRNTLPHAQAWSGRVLGIRGSVSPSSFTLQPGESRTIAVTILTVGLPANDTFNFATLELRPLSTGNPNQPWLRMPVAVAVPSPRINLQAAFAATLPAGSTGEAPFTIGNVGGSPLNWQSDNTGTANTTVIANTSDGVASGFRNTTYTDPATAGSQGQYAADDFTLTVPTQVTSLMTQGFVVSGSALTTAAVNFTWSIYPDNGGVPAGDPITTPGAAVWTYTAAPGSAGVAVASDRFSLNLPAAGQSLLLQPGKYWLVANTRGTFANRWAQYGSNATGDGFASLTVSTAGTGNWVANPSFPSLAMTVVGAVPCGAPWIMGMTPTQGQLKKGEQITARALLNASGLSAGTYRGFLCVSSNDPNAPKVASRVDLTVTP